MLLYFLSRLLHLSLYFTPDHCILWLILLCILNKAYLKQNLVDLSTPKWVIKLNIKMAFTPCISYIPTNVSIQPSLKIRFRINYTSMDSYRIKLKINHVDKTNSLSKYIYHEAKLKMEKGSKNSI